LRTVFRACVRDLLDLLAMRNTLFLLAALLAGCGGGGHHSSYSLTTSTPPVDSLAVVSGDGQTGPQGAALSQPLVVIVTDAQNNPAPGITVTFTVTAGAGSVSPTTVATDSTGQASTVFTLPSVPGASTISAGIPGAGTVSFTETAIGTMVAANPATLAFGDVVVGMSSMQTIQLTNTTPSSVSVSQIAGSGAGLSLSTPSLPVTLSPGQSVGFSAIFAPTAYGPMTGTITVTSNAATPTTTIAVTGAGVKTHSATLTWNASTSPNVTGYNAYRGTVSGGPYTRLNAQLIPALTYQDTTVQAGVTYYYVATAVDSTGAESVDSNEAVAQIPYP
jgi:hypothetical protein